VPYSIKLKASSKAAKEYSEDHQPRRSIVAYVANFKLIIKLLNSEWSLRRWLNKLRIWRKEMNQHKT